MQLAGTNFRLHNKRLAVVLFLLVLVIAGCGDGGVGGNTASATLKHCGGHCSH